MKSRRGQFFLLAAVIISAVTLSFGAITNNVVVTPEPVELDDYSFSVKREAGRVIDYEIYQNFAPNTNLSGFIDLLALEVREKDPDINFMFIYGNQDEITIRNYGNESSRTCVGGTCSYQGGGLRRISSTIRTNGISNSVSGSFDNFRDSYIHTEPNPGPDAEITVRIKDTDYAFDITPSRQVIFILQKENDEESFVYVQ